MIYGQGGEDGKPSMENLTTENKVALITGSSKGIGAATAYLLAQNGFDIVLNYLTSEAEAQALRNKIKLLGRNCIAVQADVSEPTQVEELFLQADKVGRLAVLVNNAGSLDKQAQLSDISLSRFQQTMKTNMESCFLCTKAAITRMSTKHGNAGGVIVNVSSLAAKTGSPNEYVDYAASKAAMDAFTRGVALEVAEQGIRVNGVRPGLIYTDIHQAGGEKDRVDRLKSKIPLKRGGDAKEVAEAILYLATDKSSFVTGSFIDVAGGL